MWLGRLQNYVKGCIPEAYGCIDDMDPITTDNIDRGHCQTSNISHTVVTMVTGKLVSWNWLSLIHTPLTLSQCTLACPVYTGMPLQWHWLTQCTMEYHWATERILAGYTGTPLEKLSWNSPTLECHWRNLVESAPHWDATGETLTFAAYTGTPLEGLWQHTHAPTHIVEHAE